MVENARQSLDPRQRVLEICIEDVDTVRDMVYGGGTGELDKNGVLRLHESPITLTDIEELMVFQVTDDGDVYLVETGIDQKDYFVAVIHGPKGERVKLAGPNGKFFKKETGKNTCEMQDAAGKKLYWKTARILIRYRRVFERLGSVAICKPQEH